MFISRIGNGAGTSLWYDFWLPNGGRIYNTQPARALGTTRLAWNATVADIIQNGEWLFPSGNQRLQEIWDSINFCLKVHETDHIDWKGHPSGRFTIDSAWDVIRKRKTTDPLHRVIWFTVNMLRYSMTLWLASMGRLPTLDRPQMVNHSTNRRCILCDTVEESHNHLFFECT